MFSIIVPLYNKEAEIARCIDSVLSQSCPDFELLIIDDGSTDGSMNIVRRYRDLRLHLKHQANGGVASARNMGIAVALGSWIAFLDADDAWYPDHLANLYALRSSVPQARFLFTAYWVSRGKGIQRRVALPATTRSAEVDFMALSDGLLIPSCTAFEAEALRSMGGYRELFGEDVDLWFRAGALLRTAYSSKATAVWHLDAGNRRCDQQAASTAKYVPGSLLPSLARIVSLLENDTKRAETARCWLRRRERQAVVRTVLAGDRAHAAALYAWWKEQFASADSSLELLLRMPAVLISCLATAARALGAGRSIAGYSLCRLGRTRS